MEKLLSIVIPVYNAGEYLKPCLNSILQEYAKEILDKIEIVTVNDESTDNSLQTLEKYAEKYPLIVINQHNKGCAGAVNTGLKAASGKYVWVMGDDDILVPNAINDICVELEKNPETDLLQFGVQILRNGVLKPEKCCGCPIEDKDGQKAFVCFVKNRKYSAYQFQRIVSRKLIISHEIFEKEGLTWDDTEWSPKLFSFARNVRYIPNIFYTYRRIENSVSHSRQSRKHYTDQIVVIESLNKFMDENKVTDEFRSALYSTLIGPLLNVLAGVIQSDGTFDKDLLAQFKKYEYIMDYGNFKRKYIYRSFIKIFGLKAFCKVRR